MSKYILCGSERDCYGPSDRETTQDPGQGLLSCAAGRGVAESCLAESLGSAKFIEGFGQLQQKFKEWN